MKFKIGESVKVKFFDMEQRWDYYLTNMKECRGLSGMITGAYDKEGEPKHYRVLFANGDEWFFLEEDLEK